MNKRNTKIDDWQNKLFLKQLQLFYSIFRIISKFILCLYLEVMKDYIV